MYKTCKNKFEFITFMVNRIIAKNEDTAVLLDRFLHGMAMRDRGNGIIAYTYKVRNYGDHEITVHVQLELNDTIIEIPIDRQQLTTSDDIWDRTMKGIL